jgi:hypothetical protein
MIVVNEEGLRRVLASYVRYYHPRGLHLSLDKDSPDPDEYLLGVSGRYGNVIDSIRLFTNKRNSPVFGGNGGNRTFGYTAPSGQMIVALFGRAGTESRWVGVMYAPCPRATKTCK